MSALSIIATFLPAACVEDGDQCLWGKCLHHSWPLTFPPYALWVSMTELFILLLFALSLSPSPSVLFPLPPFPCCPLFLFLSLTLFHTHTLPPPFLPLPIPSHFLHSLLISISHSFVSLCCTLSLSLCISFSHYPSLSIHPIEINDGFITCGNYRKCICMLAVLILIQCTQNYS